MQKLFLIIAGLSGAIAVGLGAFGAHGLKTRLEAIGRMEVFETAVKYQFWHTLALMAIALLMDRIDHKLLSISGYAFIAGIVIFSGSLYTLCLTNVSKWGAVTPLGGLALIAGWILMVFAVVKGWK